MTSSKPSRHEQRRQRTREAIIVAASETFLKKGVASTTVADITEAADVGYGTFYNHFHGLSDVISAVAEATMRRVVTTATASMPEDELLELAPAVSVRIIMRLLSRDPAIRWLLEQPYVFVDEWHKTVTPFIQAQGDENPRGPPDPFGSMGGLKTWIRMHPWILICELNDAIEKGSSATHEENLANMYTRLLGLSDERRAEVVEASRKIADGAKIPPLKGRARPAPKSRGG